MTQSSKRLKVERWNAVCANLRTSYATDHLEQNLPNNNANQSNHSSTRVEDAVSAICSELQCNEFVTDVVFNDTVHTLTEEQIKKLFDAIHECESATYLNLSLYTKEKQCPRLLLEKLLLLLEQNSTINTLVLKNVILEQDQLRQLIEALCNNSVLTNVDLSFNEIKKNAMPIIQHMLQIGTQFSSLNFSHQKPPIGPAEMKSLAENFRHSSRLLSLDLSMNTIRDDGAETLANSIRKHPNLLRDINISSNWIGGKGLSAIASLIRANKQIQAINLSGNCITDESGKEIVQALGHNTHLTSLDLSSSVCAYFGERSYVDVASMISTNRTLQTLNLDMNDEFADPQKLKSITDNLLLNTSLRTLTISLQQHNEVQLLQLLRCNIHILALDGSTARNRSPFNHALIQNQLRRNKYIQSHFGHPMMCLSQFLPLFIPELNQPELIFQCMRLALPRLHRNQD